MSFQRICKVSFCTPLLSLGVVTPVAARATPPIEESAIRQSTELQAYLRAAIRMYESLDYEQALEKLLRAKSYIRNLEDDALLSFYEGIVLADLNRTEQSKAAFRSGLLLKPDARLPMKVAPKVEQGFEAVRADVQRELAALQVKEMEQAAESGNQQPREQEKLADDRPAATPSVAASRPVLEPARASPGPSAVSPFSSRRISYVLMGSGATVAGAGFFLGLSGLSFNERKKEMTINEAVQARATARTQLSTGTVLLGTGLAALGAGTVLLFLPRREIGTADADSKTSLLLTPLPGGFALGATGRF